jgi:hypothetical protein
MKSNVYEEEAGAATGSRPQGGNINQDEMMKKMQAAGAPGPEHKALNAFVGDWKVEVKSWMQPGDQPSTSHGTAKVKWILGGRFLEEDFHGEMMGKPFTGHGLFGFNNSRQKFQSVWMDDVNTAIFTSEGKGESGNKVITLEGRADCPATGEKDVPMKEIFRVHSQDEHVLEMYNNGKKTMEIIYTRQ